MLKIKNNKYLPVLILSAIWTVSYIICFILSSLQSSAFSFLSLISVIFYVCSIIFILWFCIKNTNNKNFVIIPFLAYSLYLVFWLIMFFIQNNRPFNELLLFSLSSYILPYLSPSILYMISFFKPSKILAITTLIYSTLLFSLLFFASLTRFRYGIHVVFSELSSALYYFILLSLWFIAIARPVLSAQKKSYSQNSATQKQITIAEDDLESLKADFDNGLITQDEYDRRKNEIISKL